MQQAPTRRCVLATLSSAAAMSLIGGANGLAQEAPPETSTIRLIRNAGICIAPQYVADELLRAEGFTDIQRVPVPPDRLPMEGELDFAMVYTPPMVAAIEAGSPATVLAGVHVGCKSFFAHVGIRAIRDLKGKKVSAGNQAQRSLIASMAAYVGLDPFKDIEWVSSPFATAKELFVERKIDAFLALPPDPQDLRAILKATDFCASDPAAVARRLVDGGFTGNYDYALQSLKEVRYDKWREYDTEDSVRFYSLRLREAGMINPLPARLLRTARTGVSLTNSSVS